MDALIHLLARDPRIAYALLFGSQARGAAGEASDLDIAIGLETGESLSLTDLGELAADLERAMVDDDGLLRDGGVSLKRGIDLVILNEAPPALAYRIFAEGQLLSKRNHRAFVERQVRAILDYLDYMPFEALCARGVLKAAARG